MALVMVSVTCSHPGARVFRWTSVRCCSEGTVWVRLTGNQTLSTQTTLPNVLGLMQSGKDLTSKD